AREESAMHCASEVQNLHMLVHPPSTAPGAIEQVPRQSESPVHAFPAGSLHVPSGWQNWQSLAVLQLREASLVQRALQASPVVAKSQVPDQGQSTRLSVERFPSNGSKLPSPEARAPSTISVNHRCRRRWSYPTPRASLLFPGTLKTRGFALGSSSRGSNIRIRLWFGLAGSEQKTSPFSVVHTRPFLSTITSSPAVAPPAPQKTFWPSA